ncbi:MAG: dihydropteroate synthase, partial [Muribaculaceae bacterium]|nr:dihydropteroate synthase [Muribaculaceae bacterium]
GCTLDPAMGETVAALRVAYVLMHMRGTPADMQKHTRYDDVVADVIRDLAFKADMLRGLGVADIIIDPGFGFAKTVEQNYRLLACLGEFRRLGCPVLAGLSRKSMIWRPLGITPAEALPGTIALDAIALMHGADIIRVHDVAEAVQTVRVLQLLRDSKIHAI